VEVEDNEVGEESYGNHCDDQVAVAKGVGGAPYGLFEELVKEER